MKTQRLLFPLLLLFATALFVTACSKQEQVIEEPNFTKLFVKVISVDTFLLKLTIEGEVLVDEFLAPTPNDEEIPVRFVSYQNRIGLFDHYRNKMVTDTIVTYNPGYMSEVTFFQAAAGEPLQLMGKPANETAPPAGYGKISIGYTYEVLPDVVKAVVQNSPDNNGVYEPTDSFELRKGQFSKYFLARNTTNKARVSFYTSDASRKLVAQITNFQFDNMHPDFTRYLFRFSQSGALPAFLVSERLY